MIKVSVIVPTYRSGEGLARVVHSLGGQTLPAEEFEVIFVDDGSADDTWDRLCRIRDQHSNVSIHRIENSGWPSRPRNIGIDSARGEYVLFMDHDDELYPDALSAGYEFARQNRADALNGKEARTDHPKWAIGAYTENIDNVLDTDRTLPLTPMNPHKLYRRAFLEEHKIRFPEGRRVLWEDIYFNVDVQRRARVISTLADTPFYHWVQTNDNNSSTFATDPTEYWQNMRSLLGYISERLEGTQREELMYSQYVNKVLPKVSPAFFEMEHNALEEVLEHAEAILDDLIPEELDARLPPPLRARAYLLRRREHDLLRELVQVDAELVGLSYTSACEWREGELHIWSTARWRTRGDQLPSLMHQSGKILRVLPPEVETSLLPDMMDVTDAVMQVRSAIGLRCRKERITWMVPTIADVKVRGSEGQVAEVTVEAHATLDINTVIFGKPLEDVVWEFNARNELFGTENQRGLRTDLPACAALIHGRGAVAYRSQHGMLNLDLSSSAPKIISLGVAPGLRAEIGPADRSLRTFSIPLEAVHVAGVTRLEGSTSLQSVGSTWGRLLYSYRVPRFPVVGSMAGALLSRLRRSSPARIMGDERGARLEGSVRSRPGRYRLWATFNGRSVITGIDVSITRDGAEFFYRDS